MIGKIAGTAKINSSVAQNCLENRSGSKESTSRIENGLEAAITDIIDNSNTIYEKVYTTYMTFELSGEEYAQIDI